MQVAGLLSVSLRPHGCLNVVPTAYLNSVRMLLTLLLLNQRPALDHPVSTRFDTLASRAPKLPELLANQRRVGENEKRPSCRWVATASSMQRSAPFKSYPRGFP